MRIEIDQSGKTEYTSNDTVIADSLKNNVVILAKSKRIIQRKYRNINRPRLFVIELFSLLTCLLIKKSFNKSNIYIIDLEYPGHDNHIKNDLLRFAKRLNFSLSENQIRLSRIGKRSRAHKFAYIKYKSRKNRAVVDLKSINKILFP